MLKGLFQRQLSASNTVSVSALTALLLLFSLIAAPSARASSALCVNARGNHGCYATIQAAINSVSSSNSTITVAPGTYTAACAGPACSVAAIRADAPNGSALTGLTLQCGNGFWRTVKLDASRLDHAIYISGVNGVTIEGCEAENAAREGILAENANNIHIMNNEAENNDQAMALTAGKGNPPCPSFLSPGTPGTGVIQCCPDAFAGGPGNFPEDNDDCGEAIHLRGVTSSVVERNSVHDNIGGILLSDETGPDHDNLVTNNNSSNNQEFGGDCGITLASHLACAAGSNDATGCVLAPPVNGVFQGNGVFHNAVISNVTRRNGASGTGLFANPGIPPGGATKAFSNLIADNVIEDNGQPGVGIHVHAANGNADNNVITGNVLSGNGGDTEGEGNPPPNTGIEVLSNGGFGSGFSPAAPIDGTGISRNNISDEDIDVWIGNTATDASAFLNNLVGSGDIGVKNAGSGTVTATDNWWGCSKGPGASGCSSASGTVISSPFLSFPASPMR
ncbi:MAG: hypothetical protein ACREP6_15900 [Candidatus Binataceae bacterium]